MEEIIQQAGAVPKIARIVNQLHRLSGACNFPGMTLSQVSTLAYLHLSGDNEVFQKDLESYFKLRRSTVSSMLNTLEGKGIIQRIPVPRDARLKRLILTEEGRKITVLVEDTLLQLNNMLTQGLTLDEISSFYSILDKIEANLSLAEA